MSAWGSHEYSLMAIGGLVVAGLCAMLGIAGVLLEHRGGRALQTIYVAALVWFLVFLNVAFVRLGWMRQRGYDDGSKMDIYSCSI